MADPRIARLADLVCDHSCAVTADDTVLIHAFDVDPQAVAEFVSAARRRGAKVMTRLESNTVRRALLMGMTPENARTIAAAEKFEMEQVTAYIALRGAENAFEISDVPGDVMAMWQREYAVPVVFETRIPNTKWVAMRWPNAGMAQQASMSTAAFTDFYFDVCTVDYARMATACAPLAELMNRTDRVRVVGPGETDFSFSIKDIGAVPCTGERNVPDGECFTAPVKESVNGVVAFNTVSSYQGAEYANIRYVIRDGKIVEATAGAQTDRLNEILDTDPGARYFGEFALGFNPQILHPIKDTLFDEKIAGSIHFTPGNSYAPPGGNGNVSAVHWDTVLIQRPEYGGGEIFFDDVLVRKDGLFVLPELQGLNPENLRG
ncbi:MAG: aminopeptidase [Fimbriimonadaceae bacterium]|nr:aminopeptidase [Fimbriimonadaceae bacterium]